MGKWIFRGIISLVILFTALWFGGKIYFSFSVAEYEGEEIIDGIDGNIEILYDSMGVPQIYADTDRDLYFALGWTHASERLFHMELIRRVAEGRLSELFGKEALEFDIFQRKVGFARKAFADIKELDNESLVLLSSYCKGINEWIRRRSVLPPEFIVLNSETEMWSVEDVAAVMIYQTWFAHYLMDHDKEYGKLIEKLGDEIYDYVSEYKDWSPSTLFRADKNSAFLNPVDYIMSFASNSAVLSPDKSSTGYALHESDPHLQVDAVPGFWYIAGLHSGEGTNILGITVPSIPFVVMGHNADAAFAFTVASVDLIDYFRWKVNPEDSTEILTPYGYESMIVMNEEIKIKDEESYILKVELTPRGAVTDKDSTGLISLWWAGYDFDVAEILRAGFELQKVQNFEEFRKIVTSFGALDVNWTYSDKAGNIGYQLGSPVPARNFENTYSFLPGEDTLYYVKNYWALPETPFVYNPAEGFVASSNNQILSKDSNKRIPGFYDPYRIVRSTEILQSKDKFTIDDIKNFQQDLVSVKAKRWKKFLVESAKVLGEKELADELNEWDCRMELNSRPAAIFSLWWNYLPKVIFADELGEDYKLGAQILEETLSHPSAKVFDDKVTKTKVETMKDAGAIALEKVLIEFGKPELGEISFQKIKHPLSVVSILDFYFSLNRGPFGMTGDNSTLNANFMFFNEKDKAFYSAVGPSMRYILDWSDVDGFLMITNLGQSGNPFSAHYDDFLPLMQNGKYWNIPFNRDKIVKKAAGVFNLIKQ